MCQLTVQVQSEQAHHLFQGRPQCLRAFGAEVVPCIAKHQARSGVCRMKHHYEPSTDRRCMCSSNPKGGPSARAPSGPNMLSATPIGQVGAVGHKH